MNVRGEVFIAWGGNFELATAVAEELRGRGYIAQVGGIDNDASSSHFFLGDEIMAQLRRASRAIVLAAASSGVGATEQGGWLRPNLMFEWGMLAQRLHPAYLHVFLLGLQPETLPADVRGSWATTINEPDTKIAATTIAESFARAVRQMAARPLEVLVDWPAWKSWMSHQIDGAAAPDNLMLAGVLIHSIQPSFYFDDQAELRELLPALIKRPNMPLELTEALRVVSSALTYYAVTEHGVEARAKFMTVYGGLMEATRTASRDALHVWTEIVRLDFLALTVKQLADTEGDTTRQHDLLTRSADLFGEAANLLEAVADPTNAMWLLWTGYVRRNWGVVLGHLGKIETAHEQLAIAISGRRNALALLNNVDPILSTQLLLEVLYAENDLSGLGVHDPVWSLDYAVDVIKQHRPPSGRLGLWNRARRQLIKLCSDSARPDLSVTLGELT